MNIHITEKQIEWIEIHKSLEETLDKWWEFKSAEFDMPLIGDRVISIMASSALNTLLAIHSTEEYLESEGWSPDNK